MIGEDGVIRTDKAFSTPDAPERGIFDVLGRAATSLNTSVSDILSRTGIFAHGTTVSTNALITRRGARVGVLFTAGFEDTLAIGRGPSVASAAYRRTRRWIFCIRSRRRHWYRAT